MTTTNYILIDDCTFFIDFEFIFKVLSNNQFKKEYDNIK